MVDIDNEYHILNLGAGIQSTTLYLMDMDGELEYNFDYAIFADTGDEPHEVYKHLEWLQSLGGAPILVKDRGCLGDALCLGENSTGQRFVSIPAFTKSPTGSTGALRRQCTYEYKVRVVEETIRRDILGIAINKHVPKDTLVYQYIGFSMDEPGRAARARGRFNMRGWTEVIFPLIEDQMTRLDCINYLEKRVPHTVPRSACVYCPYKSDREWRALKKAGGQDWERAVEVDEALRKPSGMFHRNLESDAYIHRSCKPLVECDFNQSQMELFDMECEGGCGL
jgi:hypothetical protein